MPAQPSAKLTGGRRNGPTSKKTPQTGDFYIDPMNLGRISLNPDAIQALTLANAKVRLDISAGGTTVVLISADDGKPIGGVDDLNKLMGLRSFVTREKKHSASSETRDQMVTVAFRAAQVQMEKDKTYIQKVLDNSFVVGGKPYQAMCENVLSHVLSIHENHVTAPEYKEILVHYAGKTIRVLTQVLQAMVRGEKEKGLLETYSLENELPSYIRNKLVLKSLALPKDMDLSRILFPADPSKGLSLTVKEILRDGFTESMGKLLRNSEIIVTIVKEPKLLLELIGMTAEQFSNAEDPRVQRVLKTRITMVPPFEDHERVLNLLEKQNFRGFSLPATAMDQSKDRLANLCAVPLRAYAFSIRMAETIPDFYDRILPKGTIAVPDPKLGNYAKQVHDAIKSGKPCELIPIIRGEKEPEAFMAWVCRECKIIPNGDLYKLIAGTLGIDDPKEGMSLIDLSDTGSFPVVAPVFDAVSKATSKVELAAIEQFKETAFSITKKVAKKKSAPAASVLTRDTKVFLRHVRKEHSSSLAESMEGYFRGFYSVAIQAAAVQIAEARFDEFEDVEDAVGSSGDESSDAGDD